MCDQLTKLMDQLQRAAAMSSVGVLVLKIWQFQNYKLEKLQETDLHSDL